MDTAGPRLVRLFFTFQHCALNEDLLQLLGATLELYYIAEL